VPLLVHILFVVGGQYLNQLQWEMAAKHFEFGLQLARDEPNLRDVAKLHSLLGAAYQALGKTRLSLDHAHRAHRLLGASGDPYSAFIGEHNLGEMLLRNGDLVTAARHLEQALQVCDQNDLRRNSRCLTLCSLAEIHLAQGNLDKGRALLDEALSLSGELGERINEANAWRLLGRLHGLEDDVDAAGQLFARAIDLYTALEMPRRVHDCHVEHARLLRHAGRLEESLAHWEAAVDAVGGVKIPAQPSADATVEARNA
jgi:tetratricopeptide (TPR) repeat protein